MKNKYEYGKDFKLDELRANVNISKILKGRVKRKKRVKLSDKFTAWKTP